MSNEGGTPELDWILAGEVMFVKMPWGVLAIEINEEVSAPTVPRTCQMTWRNDELYFDGKYQHTEGFMGFVGLFDALMEVTHGEAAAMHFPAEA